MFQLIYALKKHNWRFPTPSQPRISFERAIQHRTTEILRKFSELKWTELIKRNNFMWKYLHDVTNFMSDFISHI
jgi:hypothetical protein